jgi:hypothetical protein
MRRSGPIRDRVRLAMQRRLLFGVWRLTERLGLHVATEGPPYGADPERRRELDALVAGSAVIDAATLPYPAHELLTHLVVEHGLLLHGANDTTLELLEPRPAQDYRTTLHAVVAADDGIWPIFYAVIARRRVADVFTACMHLGRPPRPRRFYIFRIFNADPTAPETWTRGAVYAVPRAGFRREWGNEWVSAAPVRPILRVLVGPEHFPLRDAVRGRSR